MLEPCSDIPFRFFWVVILGFSYYLKVETCLTIGGLQGLSQPQRQPRQPLHPLIIINFNLRSPPSIPHSLIETNSFNIYPQ
jgi:hypothetical protein